MRKVIGMEMEEVERGRDRKSKRSVPPRCLRHHDDGDGVGDGER